METAETLRHRAAEYARLASTARDPDTRADLERLARHYRTRAEAAATEEFQPGKPARETAGAEPAAPREGARDRHG